MARRRGKYRLLRYPVSMYRHYYLNKWHFFTKPKIKLTAIRIANRILGWIAR